jgi:ABC-2 type transport system ATP-binding protein
MTLHDPRPADLAEPAAPASGAAFAGAVPTAPPALELASLGHHYGGWRGGHTALEDLTLRIPEGSLVALLGPNGAGKSTLLRIVAGLQHPTSGTVRVLGHDPQRLPRDLRARVGFVGEGLRLPGWMRLGQLKRWLAPLYDSWDATLADEPRARFNLEPGRRIDTLSRGEHMKAALLCALAPRPRLLVLDEPFAGMDVAVRDELVRGILETSEAEGWTVLLASHEVAEMEALVDRVVFLNRGRIQVDASMEEIRVRYRRVEIVLPEGGERAADPAPDLVPTGAMSVERAGRRVSFITERAEKVQAPEGSRVAVRAVSLRELFVALSGTGA